MTIALRSMAFSGSCPQVLPGAICPTDMGLGKPCRYAFMRGANMDAVLNQVHVENRSSGPPFGKQATPPAPRPKGVREASSKKLPGAGI